MNLRKIPSLLTKISVAAFIFAGTFDALAAVNAKPETNVWPVMARMDYNPVLKLALTSDGETLSGVQIDLTGTTKIRDVASVDVYFGGNSVGKAGEKFGSAKVTGAPKLTVSGKRKLSGGEELWVSVQLKKDADITGKLALAVTGLTVNSRVQGVRDAKTEQRIGYCVAKPGDLGSKNYRIPALARNPKTGTLIATYDIRYNHAGDLPANIDVGVSRSTDGGKTWTPTTVAIAHKALGNGNGVGDPGILVNDANGEIWIAGLNAGKCGHPIWTSRAGTTDPANCSQMILVKSSDDGKTWSKPINITESVKRLGDPDTKNWGSLFQGPGAGICMKDGTLVFPAQVWIRNADNSKTEGEGASRGLLVYSKDGGKTWRSTKGSPFGGSESTCVEMKNGAIALNTRTNHGWGRTGSILKKLDSTTEWVIDENLARGAKGNLRQPGGCQAALLSNGKEWFFSNPNAGNRSRMTLKYSKDFGKTWSGGLLYDERQCAGYSSTAFTDEKGTRIGVLYEGTPNSQTLFFLSIPVEDVKKAK